MFQTINRVRFLLVCGGLMLLLAAVVVSQDAAAPDAVAIFNRGQDLHEKGDLAGAIKLYDEAIKLMPEFAEAEYQRGTAWLALSNLPEAERSFRRALEIRSDWTLPMTSLGSLLVRKNAFIEAEDFLRKVLEIDPLTPPAIGALAELKLKTHAPPAVLEELLKQIGRVTGRPNTAPTLWTTRAQLESVLGKRDAAKKSLTNVLSVDPKNRVALFLLADIAVAEGDVVAAKSIADRLTPGDSADGDALNLLRANIAASEARYDDAAKLLGGIQSVTPAIAEFGARLKAVQTDNTAELEKLLEGDPKNVVVLGRLCELYRRQEPFKALDHCRRAAEAEAGNIGHAVRFGAALVQAKQFDQAVVFLRKVVEAAPDNATARANLATALFQLKRLPEAKAEFQWLINAQPRSAGAYLFLGIIHDQLAEYIDAVANYQQYLKLADPIENKLDIEKVNLRMPALQKKVKTKNE